MAAQGRQGQWSKKGLDLRRLVVAMQSMLIVSDLDAADHFEIHHDRNEQEHRKNQMSHSAKKDQKHPYVTPHSESNLTPCLDPLAHQVIVLICRVAQHERTDDGHETNHDDPATSLFRRHMPAQTEQ